MKNKLFISFVLILTSFAFVSCDNDSTAGFTDITYYPVLKVLGEPVVIINKGTAYVDAGCVAELNGEDITSQVEIKSDVDSNTPGIYSISYKATNADGFSVSGKRTVYVADPTPSLISTGMHTVQNGTFRLRQGATIAYEGYDILILQIEPSVYYVSDYLGGYYDQRVGYGSKYACVGKFRLNTDNSITLIESSVAGWGDSLSELAGGTFDPVTGLISWNAKYAGMDFNVIMK